MACSFSPEALTSLASFTESLSLALGFLARANRLTAQTLTGLAAGPDAPEKRRVSQGRRSTGRRRSSVAGRRRTLGGGEGGGGGRGWSVAVDLRNVDALLTMLKNLDDQESAGHLMIAANQVRRREGGLTEWLRNGVFVPLFGFDGEVLAVFKVYHYI